MGGMMYETYMLQALTNGMQSIRQDTSKLEEILDALSLQELASAKAYFGNSKNQIYIAPGFPGDPPKFPFIGVTVANEDPIDTQIPIGLAYDRIDNGDGTWTDVKGMRYKGILKATVYTPNADLLIWLSAVCSWCLLSQIDFFTETAGINNVLVGTGDYEPAPQWLPVFTFARGIWLSGEYDKTFLSTPTPIVTSTQNAGKFIDITTLEG